MNRYAYKKEEYPHNLLTDLFEPQGAAVILPDDYAVSLEFVVLEMSQKHERSMAILLMRYKDQKTLKQIGDEYGVTVERVRQCIAKMLRFMRHPDRIGFIIYGIRGMMERKEQKAYRDGYQCGLSDGIKSVKGEVKLQEVTVERYNYPLEEMDFSVRSFNCLKRAGIKTASDIAKLDFYQLSRICNLGKKSIDEIVSKMKYLGYNTSALEQPLEDIIDDEPSVDAVEVVRCIECQHAIPLQHSDNVICSGRKVPKNGYCHRGIRRVDHETV